MEKPLDTFDEKLKRAHAFRFPGGNLRVAGAGSVDNSMALSGLYSDRSEGGITAVENDYIEMINWLKTTGIYDETRHDEAEYADIDNSRQNKMGAGLLNLWESYKFSKIVHKDLAWVSPYGLQSALSSALITRFDADSITEALKDTAVPKYTIREAKKAMESGVGIHQVYGSWEKMVMAFYKHDVELSLNAKNEGRIHFKLDAKALILKNNAQWLHVSKAEWKKVAEMHIMAELTPDQISEVYKAIAHERLKSAKEKREINKDEIAACYNTIDKSGLGLDGNGRIKYREDIGFKEGDAVYNFETKETGIVTEVIGSVIIVDTQYGQATWDKSGITRDAEASTGSALTFSS
jgi:hypothetical protein